MRGTKVLMSVVRILAFVLCLYSFQKAWAGVYLYQGEQHWRNQEFEQAIPSLQAARRLDPKNPKALQRLGESFWAAAEQDKDRIEASRQAYEDLTQRFPEYGKGWIFRAQTYLAFHEQISGPITESHWQQVQPWLEKAVELEKGNAWIHYRSARLMFLHDRFLSGSGLKKAEELMKRGIFIHYSNIEYPHLEKPSSLLMPAFRFLWARYHDFDLLKRIMPQNRESYKLMLQFLEEQKLWHDYPEIYQIYLEHQEKDYLYHCERGEQLFGENKIRDAYWAFRKAFWMRSWSYPWAKAGVLVTEYHRNQLHSGEHPLFKQDYRKVLRSILEDEDDPVGGLLPSLKLVVKQAGDPELTKLYELRTQNGRKENKEAETVRRPAGAWWGEGKTQTMGLNLAPGKKVLRVFFRPKPGQEGSPFALVKFSLNGKPALAVYQTGKNWKPADFEVHTQGGKRWLQADLIAGSVDLGPVQIIEGSP